MRKVRELQHLPSPAPRPQPVAYHNRLIWSGSWETNRLYGIGRNWVVEAEILAPGRPYGLTSFNGDLYAVVSDSNDDRYLYRCAPGRGFDEASKRACPDFTGSHLAANGDRLYLCQQGKRRVLVMDAAGNIEREISLPTRCAGIGFGAKGECFMITGNDELKNLRLARLDIDGPDGVETIVAEITFDARALAYDGKYWWSSDRAAGEIVCFSQ